MTTTPATAEADRIARLQDALASLVDFGVRLTRVVVEQAEAATLPADKAAIAYDRVTRSARRSAWLATKLTEPAKARVAARKQIIRTVEDTIQREAADHHEADDLREELMDRLDWEDDTADRPTEAIIADIIHDLGLGTIRGIHPWQRRTPADLANLQARAQQPIRHPQAHENPVGCNSS